MSESRLVDASDLVLQKDIVDRLGLNATAVANLAGGRRRSAQFPRPIQGRGNRGIWLWSEIQDWYERFWPETVEGQRAAESAARMRDVPRGRRRRHRAA